MSKIIGKSGTGIGKSGTGVGNRGAGLARARWCRSCRAFTLISLVSLLGLLPLFASANNLQITEHNGVLTVSLHDQSQLVAGRISLNDAGDFDYVSVPLNLVDLAAGSPALPGEVSPVLGDVKAGQDFDSRINSHGSGTGSSGKSHGSGTGSSGNSHGSGTGSSGNSHGSGTGSSGNSHGSGTGSSGNSHGSGTGSSGNGQIGDWGVAEVVIEPSGISVIVHKRSDQGMVEHLLAFGPALDRETSSVSPNLSIIEP